MVAYVYLLEEVAYCPGESGPWTKIGCSQNPPEWRVGANLTRGNPRDLNLAAVYQFESKAEARAAEGLAQEHFDEFAHQKEWFNIAWQRVAEWCESTMGWRKRPTAGAPV